MTKNPENRNKNILQIVGRRLRAGDPLAAPTFGGWFLRNGLIFVRADLGNKAGRPILLHQAEPVREAFLHQVASVSGELALADVFLGDDPIAQRAFERRIPIWVVPLAVLDSIRFLGGTRTQSACWYASLLARVPHYIWLHRLLRRIPPRGRGHQLGLL